MQKRACDHSRQSQRHSNTWSLRRFLNGVKGAKVTSPAAPQTRQMEQCRDGSPCETSTNASAQTASRRLRNRTASRPCAHERGGQRCKRAGTCTDAGRRDRRSRSALGSRHGGAPSRRPYEQSQPSARIRLKNKHYRVKIEFSEEIIAHSSSTKFFPTSVIRQSPENESIDSAQDTILLD
jgi:hypothetical protein